MAAIAMVLVVAIVSRSGIAPPVDRWLTGILDGGTRGSEPSALAAATAQQLKPGETPVREIGGLATLDFDEHTAPTHSLDQSASIFQPPGPHSATDTSAHRGTDRQALDSDNEAPDAEKAGADETSDDPTEDPSDDDAILSISGRVQDEFGEPVPGIRVVAAARHLFGQQENAKPRGSQRQQTASTDSEGYFDIPQLADGEYLVSTVATAHYGSAATSLRAGTNSAVLVVKSNSADTVYVSGTITGNQGQPLPDAHARSPGAVGSALSGEDGRYRLKLDIRDREKTYSVLFTKDGYRAKSLAIQGSVENGAEIWLDAALEPEQDTAAVNGTVTGPDGTNIPGARIELWSARLQRSYRARSNQAGQFSLSAVEVGDDYRLWVRPRSDYEQYLEQPVSIPPGGRSLSVLVQPLSSGTLRGRMVDAEGSPVPGFSLWLRSFAPSAQQQRVVTSDRDGQFTVTDLPAGEVSFFTQSSPFLRVIGLDFSPATQKSIQLALDFGSYTVGGHVVDPQGNPVAGAQVSLTWSHANGEIRSRSRRTAVTGRDGSFLFEKVGAGWHELSADAAGYHPSTQGHDVSLSGGNIVVSLQGNTS
jgi:protocatechuate 3,4-dioxygenase beta subunit